MKKFKFICIFISCSLLFGVICSYFIAIKGEKPLTNEARKMVSGNYVRISSGIIHYNWYGPEDGPVIVLVHGFSIPSVVFNKNIPGLTNAGFRVLTFDHFGRGFSDRPSSNYDDFFFDQELIELLTALNIKHPINLLGYSLGGGIAGVFASRHPEFISKLILVAPVGYMPKPTGVDRLIHIPVVGEWMFGVFSKKRMLQGLREIHAQGIYDDEMFTAISKQFEFKGWRTAFIATIRHFPFGSLGSDFKNVGRFQIPTLVIWGKEDDDVPTSGSSSLQKDIPGAQLKIIPNAGHLFISKHPEAANKLIIDFLKL